MSALRSALQTAATRLSQQVLDEMYENPWWMQRYGERGRHFADQDSLYHISYLDAALAANDAAVFEKYALWLRSVLVSRGMCSAHLGENFQRLSQAIRSAGLPDARAAHEILERGWSSLRYVDGPAARLQADEDALLAAIRDALPRGVDVREDDLMYLVSYLIDGVATGEMAHFELFAARFPAGAVDALRKTASPHLPDAPVRSHRA